MADGSPNLGIWQEKMYMHSHTYDTDGKFFENCLKSSHIEGKMSAREMTFAKGAGLPTAVPVSGAAGPQPPA